MSMPAPRRPTGMPVFQCLGVPAEVVQHNDPLWKLRHALAGVGIALVAAVFTAAAAGRVLGDAFGGDYGMRVLIYGALLLYLVVGAGVLFAKVARHETRPLSAARVAVWFASLWLWPALLLAGGKRS